jgi:hypothetical protein
LPHEISLYHLIQFFFISTCHSQPKDGSVYFSPRVGYLNLEGLAPRLYGGMELEIMVGDRFGIHCTLLGGQDYFHMPLAPFVGVLKGFVIGSTESGLDPEKRNVGLVIVIGIITALIP